MCPRFRKGTRIWWTTFWARHKRKACIRVWGRSRWARKVWSLFREHTASRRYQRQGLLSRMRRQTRKRSLTVTGFWRICPLCFRLRKKWGLGSKSRKKKQEKSSLSGRKCNRKSPSNRKELIRTSWQWYHRSHCHPSKEAGVKAWLSPLTTLKPTHANEKFSFQGLKIPCLNLTGNHPVCKSSLSKSARVSNAATCVSCPKRSFSVTCWKSLVVLWLKRSWVKWLHLDTFRGAASHSISIVTCVNFWWTECHRRTLNTKLTSIV